VGFASDQGVEDFFQVFGIVYAAVAALGFYYGNQPCSVSSQVMSPIRGCFRHRVDLAVSRLMMRPDSRNDCGVTRRRA